jgi:hypothetical protein
MEASRSFESLEIGGGRVEWAGRADARLTLPAIGRGYGDAQIDDTRRLPRGSFPWRPPLRLRLRARASHAEPPGTLGFGFWNDPFAVSLGQGGAARRLPAPPRAVWFFYASPPAELGFTPGVPGHGWKAMSLRAPAVPALLLAPAAAAALLLTRLPPLRSPVMRLALGSVAAAEALLAARLAEWHAYGIDWSPGRVRFSVDDRVVLESPSPPPGPLGFVAWIDNQYAVASPESGLRFGTLPTSDDQWLEIAGLEIERL